MNSKDYKKLILENISKEVLEGEDQHGDSVLERFIRELKREGYHSNSLIKSVCEIVNEAVGISDDEFGALCNFIVSMNLDYGDVTGALEGLLYSKSNVFSGKESVYKRSQVISIFNSFNRKIYPDRINNEKYIWNSYPWVLIDAHSRADWSKAVDSVTEILKKNPNEVIFLLARLPKWFQLYPDTKYLLDAYHTWSEELGPKVIGPVQKWLQSRGILSSSENKHKESINELFKNVSYSYNVDTTLQ